MYPEHGILQKPAKLFLVVIFFFQSLCTPILDPIKRASKKKRNGGRGVKVSYTMKIRVLPFFLGKGYPLSEVALVKLYTGSGMRL